MKFLKVGDTSKAVCEHCKSIVSTTYKLRDVPFSDGRGIAKKIMAGVCDQCDSVVSVPHQSVPAIKEQYEVKRQPVEVRLPAHLIDVLNVATEQLGANPDFVPHLIKYYVHLLATNQASASKIAQYLKQDLAKGKSDKRLSLKGRMIADEIEQLKVLSHLNKTTDVLKSVILKINEDLIIKKSMNPIKQLKGIMAAVA